MHRGNVTDDSVLKRADQEATTDNETKTGTTCKKRIKCYNYQELGHIIESVPNDAKTLQMYDMQ